MKIKVGSRDSILAVAQSNIVIECIKKYHKDVEIELVTMKTTGDIILDRTLDKVGGKGLFVKELDRALLDGVVDITVHSMKDLPMELHQDLPIVAVSKRESPEDVLVLPENMTEIDFTKPIGCSSVRRKIHLEKLYDGCIVEPIRGNVQTRLRKLDSGEFSATTLAKAGLKRLGLENRISKEFTTEEMLPAACQGVIVVQSRKGFDTFFLKEFHHEESEIITRAERSFVRELNGGCSSPVACFGEMSGKTITLTGFVVDNEGKSYREKISGEMLNGEQLGKELAVQMKRHMV